MLNGNGSAYYTENFHLHNANLLQICPSFDFPQGVVTAISSKNAQKIVYIYLQNCVLPFFDHYC